MKLDAEEIKRGERDRIKVIVKNTLLKQAEQGRIKPLSRVNTIITWICCRIDKPEYVRLPTSNLAKTEEPIKTPAIETPIMT